MYAAQIPKRTQADLLAEKELKDYTDNVKYNKKGLPGHLLFGHGPELASFEKRDLATTNYLSYEKRMTADRITHPLDYKNENPHLLSLKGKQEKPALLQKQEEGIQLKPRPYNEFTKKIDLNYNKLKLRQ